LPVLRDFFVTELDLFVSSPLGLGISLYLSRPKTLILSLMRTTAN